MLKKVYINKTCYTIDCDLGTQDVCWLAMAACYEHGNNSYPVAKLLPCMATNQDGEILHPKMVICKNQKKIGEEINVKTKCNPSDIDGAMSEEETTWFNQAFGSERFMMEVKIRLIPSNELKKDYFVFSAVLNYKINQNLAPFFPDNKQTFSVDLEEISNKNKGELYQCVFKIPFGSLEFVKICYKDKDGNERDTFDTKNKIVIEKFPEPLLPHEKEIMIRNKESQVKKKELSLRHSIKVIEDEKQQEEERMKALQGFLNSLPCSIEEIFEYCNKEIPDATEELVVMYSYFESYEFSLLKTLYEIFTFFAKFYDNNVNLVVDVETMMYFYKTFFDLKKDELSSLLLDVKKFYLTRLETLVNYSFLEFCFSIVYIFYNMQIYKTVAVEYELNQIRPYLEKKLEDDGFKDLYNDDLVFSLITSNIEFLKTLFQKFSNTKFENYSEMTPNQFILFVKEICAHKGFDAIAIIEKKFLNDICFFEFLEKVVWIANKSYPAQMDLFSKVSDFIDSMQTLWSDLIKV